MALIKCPVCGSRLSDSAEACPHCGLSAERFARRRAQSSAPKPTEAGALEVVRAVLLTSSGKNGAACVAGYDLRTKRFVRFVSDPVTAAGLPFEEIRGLAAFDIVEAEALQKCPIRPQTENIHIKPFGLQRIGRFSGTIEDIRKEIRYQDRNSLAGRETNRLYRVDGYQHSLEIISVRDLVLKKTVKSDGGITTRAAFAYRGKSFTDYRVTDFSYDLREGKESEIRIPYADLVLSIPKEAYIKDGHNLGYFKFVAAIFETDPPGDGARQAQAHDVSADNAQPFRNAASESKGNAGKPWTAEEEMRLLREFKSGLSVLRIAKMHGRSLAAIHARLKKWGMLS